MSDIDTRARELFLQALDLQPEQIAGFLDMACDGDAELRQRVQKLLDAHNEAGEFLAPSHMKETVIKDLEEPALDDFPKTTASATQNAGATIGPYKLLEQIGEGGMGSVWVASQSEPIKRRVAIKLIKAGMDTGQVLARFEAERQALAMMDHPNIARVLDGGMTDQGRPYFAMEYVKGVPLTEYCDNAKLSLKERLELFVPVCQAVQHAHQKGVIHRDLKPSNILVCLYDGKPVPKVIDFGLAKAMHQSLTDHSIYTAHGMMVGTPLYMSPEQAEQNNLDIDTRTDIYALGVILYELLTGTTPLERAEMKQAAYDEVLRLIKEVEPPKPSMRLSGSDSLPSVAAQRGIEPAQLTRSISGDLDWVVMKALEKERSRRYETANGLAEDIRRHLADEPISASPPSTSYRVKKFIRRNRAGVIAASAIGITLLLGVAGTTGGMLWALSSKKVAVDARQAESDARLEAQENATRARDEAKRATAAESKTAETLKAVEAERDAKEVALKDAEQLSEFLTNVFQSPDPTRDGREIKVVELLDNAAKKLETGLSDQPEHRAKFQATLGRTYQALGLWLAAIPLQEQVRDFHVAISGKESPVTVRAMITLAGSYSRTGRHDEALKMREELLTLRRKVHGPEHPYTLSAMLSLASSYSATGRKDDAIKMREEVLTLRREVLGPEHFDTLRVINTLAASYDAAGRKDDAVTLYTELLTERLNVLGPKHPGTITVMVDLANFYFNGGRKDDALKLREEVLALRREVLGPEHYGTWDAMRSLAASYDAAGRKDDAVTLYTELLTERRNVLGPKHPDTITVMNSLAHSYSRDGRKDDALKLREEVLALRREVLGPEHHGTWDAMRSLAASYDAAGRKDDAVTLYTELLTERRNVLGPKHTDTITVMVDLASAYGRVGRKDDAIKMCEEVLTLRREVLRPEHSDTISAMITLASAYRDRGRYVDAVKLREEVLSLRRKVLGPLDYYTIVAMRALANAYAAVNRHSDAVQIREDELASIRKVYGSAHRYTLSAMFRLAHSYEHAGRIDNEIAMRQETLEVSRKVYGPEHSSTLNAESKLVSVALSGVIAQIWEDDTKMHAARVRRLFVLILDSTDPQVLERMAKTACLVTDSDPATYQNAVLSARKVLELGKDHRDLRFLGRRTLGMALYRTGNYAEADEVLGEVHGGGAWVDGTAAFFRSMALFRQGKEDAARDLFVAAREKMKPIPEDDEEPLKGVAPDQVITWLAYREADALINR